MANNVLRLPIGFVPLWRQTKANEDMKKTLNIEEKCKRMKKHWTIGWVPSDGKNWMPVKLRSSRNFD